MPPPTPDSDPYWRMCTPRFKVQEFHPVSHSTHKLSSKFLHAKLGITLLSFREGSGTPFQYSCLENPMDGGAWYTAAHGVANSWTRLSDFIFNFHFHALEKEMATHSCVLAWRLPGMGEPGGLLSMGSHRVRHN